jgi:hypothetical protein
MQDNDGLKIVEFEKYCKTCAHKDKKESEDPCWDCLNEPARPESHKPKCWEGK